jgi:hypothetical protein
MIGLVVIWFLFTYKKEVCINCGKKGVPYFYIGELEKYNADGSRYIENRTVCKACAIKHNWDEKDDYFNYLTFKEKAREMLENE